MTEGSRGLDDGDWGAVEAGELETGGALGIRGGQVLQDGDGDLFAQAKTGFGIAAVVDAGPVAAHGNVEGELVDFTTYSEGGVGVGLERKAIGTGDDGVGDNFAFVDAASARTSWWGD